MNNIKIGDVVTCEVTGITNYGVFVKLENGYDGLIHISEISDKFISNLERMFIAGDFVDAKVLEIDEETKQVKLSLKSVKKSKKDNKQIVEKGKGFEPLKENLDIWVKERLEELDKTTKTP